MSAKQKRGHTGFIGRRRKYLCLIPASYSPTVTNPTQSLTHQIFIVGAPDVYTVWQIHFWLDLLFVVTLVKFHKMPSFTPKTCPFEQWKYVLKRLLHSLKWPFLPVKTSHKYKFFSIMLFVIQHVLQLIGFRELAVEVSLSFLFRLSAWNTRDTLRVASPMKLVSISLLPCGLWHQNTKIHNKRGKLNLRV